MARILSDKDKETLKRYRAANKDKVRFWQRQSYLRNKAYYKQRSKIRLAAVTKWLNHQKDKPCADCNQTFPPFVMDFDHKPGFSKVSNIAALRRKASVATIEKEIEKCDLVCANCHRIRTQARYTYTEPKPIPFTRLSH